MGGFATPITYLIRETQDIFIDGQDLEQDFKIIYKVAAECKPGMDSTLLFLMKLKFEGKNLKCDRIRD